MEGELCLNTKPGQAEERYGIAAYQGVRFTVVEPSSPTGFVTKSGSPIAKPRTASAILNDRNPTRNVAYTLEPDNLDRAGAPFRVTKESDQCLALVGLCHPWLHRRSADHQAARGRSPVLP